MLKYLALTLLLLTSSALANCIKKDDNCISTKEWQFSVAMGAGVLTNPLRGGDNYPLLVIPYVSYYGDHIFLENNVLGYTLEESKALSVSLITQLNREAAFFSQWHPSQFLLPNYTGGFNDSAQEVEITQVATRRWAIDAGLQLNWFPNQNTHIEMQLLHDINNVYNGTNAHWAFHYSLSTTTFSKSRFVLTLGINWQSKALVNYYYNDEVIQNLANDSDFRLKAIINPYLKMNVNIPINENWQAKIGVKREFIGNNLAKSPLVEDKYIDVAFIGLVYAF